MRSFLITYNRTLVQPMLSSYLAPAYRFNGYIDAFKRDIVWDDIKYEMAEENWISSTLRRDSYQIDVQAILLSIKMALDRMVAIFS
ncbi:hypothetical protein [Bacillus sp. RIT694]|uniref:hypothetical protein n=1 Tax=Bacillus sp. RIT694 TaxID=2666190 RepID=UPI0012ACB463|nr:hypothetical protein [Bacillus sp. RIT694]MRS25596.1 hypothetical protein [Bacillus sp. RIT694]